MSDCIYFTKTDFLVWADDIIASDFDRMVRYSNDFLITKIGGDGGGKFALLILFPEVIQMPCGYDRQNGYLLFQYNTTAHEAGGPVFFLPPMLV